ncbi:MAG: SGNH/GDSL hydrolase family protein [Rubrivivax sp.]|nr:MAG: SGNH/GDSL hydrolase family protein [Rubrivivax sp.]
MLNSSVAMRGAWARGIALLALALTVGCAQPPKGPPAGAPWTAAWGSAQLEQAAPAPGVPELANGKPVATVWRQPLRDVTLRQVVRVTAAGTALRVRVSNLFGREPLQLDSASIALVQGEPGTQQPVLQAGSQRVLTFAGLRSLTLAPGSETWSDPVDLAVPRLADLTVQWHVLSAPAVATVHPGSRIQSWAVAGPRTDAAWPDAAARDGWWHLAAVDVRAVVPQAVLAATGDSITDGYGVTAGSYQRWTDALARRIASTGRDAAVINTGIGGGRLLRDGLGPNLVSRFDRDVLERSGVTHAVVLIGVNDLGVSHRGRPTTAESRAALLAELKGGFTAVATRARERGVCLLASTVMPYGGSGYYQPQAENEADRQALNDWIRTSGIFAGVVDFDAIARDPARPTHLRADWDNDGLHPSMAGYRAMADAFPLDFLERRCAPAAVTGTAMPAGLTR